MTPSSRSTRPYLIRALYEWCTDNGFTPYVAVAVDENVQVPREFVKDNEIVLNIGFDATSSLSLGNEFIEFKARFAGSAREILVPISHVLAIYARENGQGMAFPRELHPTPAGAPPAPGLALPAVGAAPAASEAAPEVGFMQLVPETAAPTTPADGESPEPPPPSRPRPALKRVK